MQQIKTLRDRAHVLLDGNLVALLDRKGSTSFNLVGSAGERLELIVENMGRINYGKDMIEQNKVPYFNNYIEK